MASDERIRLQRFLAQAGIASRRKSEELITAGKVKVNNRVVRELGTKVDPRKDKVHYGGRRVLPEEHVWVLLNKPDGTVSTVSDPEGRDTVMDVIGPQHVRLYPVGRLDYHTQGALLLTNDGELANALAHPRGEIPRVYHVKLRGAVSGDDLEPLRTGVTLDTGETVKAVVGLLGSTGVHTWIEMILTQGLNHQVHRMVDCIGGTVLKLIRVAYGPLTVEDLPPGKHRLLGQTEIDKLRKAVNLPAERRRDREQQGRRGQGQARSRARTQGPKKPRGKGRPQGSGKPGSGKPGGGKPGAGRKPGGGGKPVAGRKAGGGGKPDAGRKPGGGGKPGAGRKPGGGRPGAGRKPGGGRKPGAGRKPATGGRRGAGKRRGR